MADTLTFGDQLRIEGINFKGFGIIPKYVMIDQDLTIGAKSLYAYFCSYAGSGNSTFPSREKILADLKIGKRAYYNDLNLLTEQGYIKVEQKKHSNNQFNNNIYTLISNPKKFELAPDDSSKSKVYSKISVSGLKSAGFGMIPKAVMTDERLPLKSKGIYAYFCSFTGAGDSACPKLETILYHLRISHDTYYKYFNMLTKLNYISVVQRHENGLLGVNDYYVNDNPDESACNIKEISLYSQANRQLPKNEDTENEDAGSQLPKNEDTIINNIKNNNKKNNTNKLHTTTISRIGARAREEDGSYDNCGKPTIQEVAQILRQKHFMDHNHSYLEAERFLEYNEARGWDCLPYWKVALIKWCEQKDAYDYNNVIPTLGDVAKVLEEEFVLSISESYIEADKFIRYNEARNWDCMPHWKVALNNWCKQNKTNGDWRF